MYAIVSAGRTGSSLMMQTLLHLGVPVAAPKFLPEHIPVEKYNVKGFYELRHTVNGVTDNRYEGQAVKLFGYGLINTPKHLIKKIIYCQRDRVAAINSYIPVKEILETTTVSAADIWDANHRAIHDYLKGMDYLVVPFVGIRNDPEKWVWNIAEYLEIKPSASQVEAAVKNVEPIYVDAIKN